MDAHLDPSDILNLFTGEYDIHVGQVTIPRLETFSSLIDLAEKQAMDVEATIKIAQETIHTLQSDLTRKDC